VLQNGNIDFRQGSQKPRDTSVIDRLPSGFDHLENLAADVPVPAGGGFARNSFATPESPGRPKSRDAISSRNSEHSLNVIRNFIRFGLRRKVSRR
jgi:hypothetical protein